MPNHIQAEQKKSKAQQIKKLKAERLSQRSERLAKQNPRTLEIKIKQLASIPSPSQADLRRLQTLEKELNSVKAARKRLGFIERQSDPRKSVFYDSILNPTGEPPEGFDPISIYDVSPDYTTDEDVKGIPWPKYKQGSAAAAPAQAVYESQPVMRDLDKEARAFVPATVTKRRKID